MLAMTKPATSTATAANNCRPTSSASICPNGLAGQVAPQLVAGAHLARRGHAGPHVRGAVPSATAATSLPVAGGAGEPDESPVWCSTTVEVSAPSTPMKSTIPTSRSPCRCSSAPTSGDGVADR